jgi:hypothetical protein
MTHKNKWRRKGKQHIKIQRQDSSWTKYSKLSIPGPNPLKPESEISRDTESQKGICPICGKKKLGLAAHMAAKHASVAVPQAPDQFMNLVFGKNQPAPSWPVAADKTKPAAEAQTAASNRRQTSKIAGKKKRRCPICSVLFSRLAQHISQAHDQVLTECPSCYVEVVVKPAGKRHCGECRKSFTIGANGKAVGFRAECPGCYNDFYTEKLGLLACPTCKMKTVFDAKGKPC